MRGTIKNVLNKIMSVIFIIDKIILKDNHFSSILSGHGNIKINQTFFIFSELNSAKEVFIT